MFLSTVAAITLLHFLLMMPPVLLAACWWCWLLLLLDYYFSGSCLQCLQLPGWFMLLYSWLASASVLAITCCMPTASTNAITTAHDAMCHCHCIACLYCCLLLPYHHCLQQFAIAKHATSSSGAYWCWCHLPLQSVNYCFWFHLQYCLLMLLPLATTTWLLLGLFVAAVAFTVSICHQLTSCFRWFNMYHWSWWSMFNHQ